MVILKPEEGKNVVVFDHLQYDEAILDIINDKAKLKKTQHNVTKKREEKHQRLLRHWKKNNVLNQLVYENIYPTGSATAKIYDITKMYKYTPSNLFPKF